jgi:hypothetical protein
MTDDLLRGQSFRQCIKDSGSVQLFRQEIQDDPRSGRVTGRQSRSNEPVVDFSDYMLFQIICLTNPIFVGIGITKSGTPEN